MENSNYDEILSRWLANELSEEELSELKQREDYAELEAIVNGVNNLEPPVFIEQESWNKLEGKRQSVSQNEDTPSEPDLSKTIVESESAPPLPHENAHIETPIKTISRRNWIYATAAVFALALAAIFWLQDDSPNYSTMISTEAGVQRELSLPDNSEVELNAATTIGFSKETWPDEREVYLAGEAFFRAKKGKTFTVITDQGSVKVIGTKFNVYARNNELEVKCTEGQVQVLNPESTEKVLIKNGEQVTVLNGRMQKRHGLDFTPKWYKGDSIFRNAPRSKVFHELEHQYGITVIDDAQVTNTHTGKFVHDDLEKALKMVAVPMQLEYQISGDTVRFYKVD